MINNLHCLDAVGLVKLGFLEGVLNKGDGSISACCQISIEIYLEKEGRDVELRLEGKRALITGASSGIGQSCAEVLAQEGVHVCGVARSVEGLETTLERIKSNGSKGWYVAVDLSTEEGCKRAVDGCVDQLGGVDILVNCAGAAKSEDVLEVSKDLIDEALQLKSYGYLRLSQLVIPYMRAQGWGRIINIAGRAGASPERGNVPVSLSNIVVLNNTRALADAVSADGILVNTICPGMTNTRRTRNHHRARAEKEGRPVEELINELGSQLPAGRIAEPAEIANAVCFLASEACSYMFGTSIYMDGGHRRATP